MRWDALNTSREFGALYQSECERWYIRHYTEIDERGRGTLGFGATVARLYDGPRLVKEFTGPGALLAAQEWASGEGSTKGEAA